LTGTASPIAVQVTIYNPLFLRENTPSIIVSALNWDAFNATSPISKFLIKKSQKFNAKNGITLVETPFPQIIEWMAVRRSKRNVSVCFYRKCKYPIDSRKKMTPQSGSYSEGCFGLAWQNIKMMRPSSQ